MPPEDRIRVQHMIDAAELAMGFANGRQRADLDHDRMRSFAFVRAIEIIGEAARHVSTATRASIATVPWEPIVRMRHRVVHAYVNIDHETVWNTDQAELPRLVTTLKRGAGRNLMHGAAMAAWKKVPTELAARFDAALPVLADIERRKMFGCPAAFVNGNLFAGLHEDRLMVRLPVQAPNRPCVIMGRTMKDYALFPNALEMADRDIAGWVGQAYAFTRALAPKPPNAAKAPAKRRTPA